MLDVAKHSELLFTFGSNERTLKLTLKPVFLMHSKESSCLGCLIFIGILCISNGLKSQGRKNDDDEEKLNRLLQASK